MMNQLVHAPLAKTVASLILVLPLLGANPVPDKAAVQATASAAVPASGTQNTSDTERREVRFIRHEFHKGQTILEDTTFKSISKTKLHEKDKITETVVRMTATLKCKTTILDVEAGKISRVRIEYLEQKQVWSNDADKPKTYVSELSGKSYVVTGKDGAPDVVASDGHNVSTKEATGVKETFIRMVENGLVELLPDRPIRIGETLRPPTGSKVNGSKFEVASLTFKGVEGPKSALVGMFDLAISDDADGSRYSGKMKLFVSGAALKEVSTDVQQEDTRTMYGILTKLEMSSNMFSKFAYK